MKSESFAPLINCTYRKDMLYGLGGRASQFNMTAMLANAVRVVEVRRPTAPFMLDELVDFVQEQIG